MNATVERLSIGDAVILRSDRRRIEFGVVAGLIYKPNPAAPPKACRKVRWANIRTRRAMAILTDGRTLWGHALDPIRRG